MSAATDEDAATHSACTIAHTSSGISESDVSQTFVGLRDTASTGTHDVPVLNVFSEFNYELSDQCDSNDTDSEDAQEANENTATSALHVTPRNNSNVVRLQF